MEKRSLEQALTERRNANTAVEAKRQQENAAKQARYLELITSGSGLKADVDEMLKLVGELGKSEKEMYRDLDNIESAKKMVREMKALAGCETNLEKIGSLRPWIDERTRAGIRRLQRQLGDLQRVIESMGERVVKFNSLRKHLIEFKNSNSELLAGIELPDSSLPDVPCDLADALPEMRAWLDGYVEARPVSFTESMQGGAK